jgi:hypothetical protein|eukprot:COSAG02_NODE_64_length_43111_cov_35.627709_35_plen_62_part_00
MALQVRHSPSHMRDRETEGERHERQRDRDTYAERKRWRELAAVLDGAGLIAALLFGQAGQG